MARRKLAELVRGKAAVDGAGVKLRRVLGPQTVKNFDPFLMLDGFDSTDPADYVAGFPWHPHRGIETVTYLISGDIEHGDSLGNSGSILDGQCQWMTAGSGIIHQEMPKASARMLGCQLWVNLPAKEKMCQPSYRDIKAEQIALTQEGGATIRVLSGSYRKADGSALGGVFRGEHVRVQYLDISLKPDLEWSYSQCANEETLFLYLVEGSLACDEGLSSFESKGCALRLVSSSPANARADELVIKAGREGARLLLISGKPLREAIAWGGPIVMNSQAELDTAFAELDAGSFIKHS